MGKVVRADFDPSTMMPVKTPSGQSLPRADEPYDLIWTEGAHQTGIWKWPNRVRFVDTKFDRKGRLLVSDDVAGYVVMLVYTGDVQPPKPTLGVQPNETYSASSSYE